MHPEYAAMAFWTASEWTFVLSASFSSRLRIYSNIRRF